MMRRCGTKITLLVLLGVVSGVLVAKIDSALGHHFWVLVPGLAFVAVALLWLARHWVCSPLERLLVNLNELGRLTGRTGAGDLLPSAAARMKSAGRAALPPIEQPVGALRYHEGAQQLRRTLDHRIAQATREATGQLRQMAMRDPLT